MEQTKTNNGAKWIISGIAVYLSYCMAYWYQTRGLWSVYAESIPMLNNEAVAFLFAGAIAYLLYFLSEKMIFRNLIYKFVMDWEKPRFNLRMFIIAANIVTFGLSFLYMYVRPSFVWGTVLAGFVSTLLFLTGYLFYQVPRISQKSVIATFIMQVGSAFLTVFGVMSVVTLLMEVL